MITPYVNCFYAAQIEGAAAQHFAEHVSSAAAKDITTFSVISEEYTDDISACNDFDTLMHETLEYGDTLKEQINPFYVPSSIEAIEDMLDEEEDEGRIRFTGMDGNPFTLKLSTITNGEAAVARAKVQFKPFDFPSFDEIVQAQNVRLN